MKLSKKTNIKRFSIYTIGLFSVLSFVCVESFDTREKTFFNENNENFPIQSITIPSTKKYSHATVDIVFKSDDYQIEKTVPKIDRTASILLRERKNTITETDDLKKLLFDDNLTDYPNGSLVELSKKYYFLEKGKLRLVPSKTLFEQTGFNTNNITRNDEVFSSLEKSVPISKDNPLSMNPPIGLIVKSGQNYFITSAKHIYPIFSKKIIESLWPKFSFVEFDDISLEKMQNMQCYKSSPEKLFCETKLNQNEKGDVYYLSILGIPTDAIKETTFSIQRKPTRETIFQDIKNLIW